MPLSSPIGDNAVFLRNDDSVYLIAPAVIRQPPALISRSKDLEKIKV